MGPHLIDGERRGRQADTAGDIEPDSARRHDTPRRDLGCGDASDREAVAGVDVGHPEAGDDKSGQSRHVDDLVQRLVSGRGQQRLGREDYAWHAHPPPLRYHPALGRIPDKLRVRVQGRIDRHRCCPRGCRNAPHPPATRLSILSSNSHQRSHLHTWSRRSSICPASAADRVVASLSIRDRRRQICMGPIVRRSGCRVMGRKARVPGAMTSRGWPSGTALP